MSEDIAGLKSCTHVRNKYTLSSCPVCLGKGFYFDIVLSQNGQLQTTSGLGKVVQGLTHLLATDEGAFVDYGYSDYGSRLRSFIGSKNLSETGARFQVLKDLEYYMGVKELQHRRFQNITEDELINDIVSIDTQNSVDEQKVSIQFRIGNSSDITFLSFNEFVL